ncbi:MAG: hypothetical protein ACKVH8_11065 [Pirellulales bacterium]
MRPLIIVFILALIGTESFAQSIEPLEQEAADAIKGLGGSGEF